MGNWRKENADDLEDSIFANNPFLDDLLEWRHSPEGQQFAELADALLVTKSDVAKSEPKVVERAARKNKSL